MSKTKFSVLLLPVLVLGALMSVGLLGGQRAQALVCSTGTPDSQAACQQINTTDAAENPFSSASVPNSGKQCGKGDSTYTPVIDLGCQGNDYRGAELNPVLDLTFALLKFITIGVGLVCIGSIIAAGIQFTASQGEPAGTAKAIGRIGNTLGALLLYIVAWALLNWLVPGGLFNG